MFTTEQNTAFYQVEAETSCESRVDHCVKCGASLLTHTRRRGPQGQYCNSCGVKKMRVRHHIEQKVITMKTITVPFVSIEQHDEFSNSREKIHGLEELAQSIQEVGLQNEPVVWRIPCPETDMPWGKVTHRDFLVVGFRRLAALNLLRAKAKGKKEPFDEVPVKVYEGDLQGAMRLNLTENLQRQDLTLFEIGTYLSKIREETGASYSELAEQVGKTKQWVGEVVRFVGPESTAVDDLKALVRDGVVGMWQGLAFAKKTTADQLKICNRIKSAQRLSSLEESETDPLAEELDKIKKEEKKAKKKVRNKAELEAKLKEYALADISKLKEVERVHFYGLVKSLEWALGNDVDWNAAKPSHTAEGAITFVKGE